MRVLPAAASLAILGLTTAHASSQAVISKVDFPGQTIEIYNTNSSQEVDLSTWSIYYATTTLGQPGNYWFAFPVDTIIPPNDFLQVHWLAPIGPMPPGELNTGSSIFNFLFGFYPEALLTSPTAGEPTFTAALALLNTQNNLQINNPAVYQDWLTWGDASSGARPPREDIAVAAGKWSPGDTLASPRGNGATIGRDDVVTGSVFWSFAAQVNSSTCLFSFPNPITPPTPPPTLSVFTEANTGNLNFGIRVLSTASTQTATLLVGTQPGSSSPVVLNCPIWVGGSIVAIPFVPQDGNTDLSASLAGFLNLPQADVYLQPLTIETVPDPGMPGETVLLIGFGNGSKLTIGV